MDNVLSEGTGSIPGSPSSGFGLGVTLYTQLPYPELQRRLNPAELRLHPFQQYREEAKQAWKEPRQKLSTPLHKANRSGKVLAPRKREVLIGSIR